VRAVVLVGGFGTRLRPLTLSTPKQMLPVAGRAMIEHVVGHLGAHGVDEVVLSLGYRPDAFQVAYPVGRCAGVAVRYAVEPEPLDTAGAIAFAARDAGIDERFIVVNGDVLTDIDVSALMAFHGASNAEGTIALTRVDDPSQFGVVVTDEVGRVLAFVEKPPADEAPTDLINAGYYVLEPSVIDRVPDGARVNIERVTFPAMVADRSLFARADPAWWLDVGTPERYIEGNLRLARSDAVVDPSASVAADAVIERSVVLSRAVVEAGAVVRDSVVGPGAFVGRGAVIEGMTVLGDEARVEAGVRLSGARLPEPQGT
jgi:mannose-1-phosphate guanylyltransferase